MDKPLVESELNIISWLTMKREYDFFQRNVCSDKATVFLIFIEIIVRVQQAHIYTQFMNITEKL